MILIVQLHGLVETGIGGVRRGGMIVLELLIRACSCWVGFRVGFRSF